MPIFTMRESIHRRREIVFAGTGMETVYEMVVSSGDAKTKVAGMA